MKKARCLFLVFLNLLLAAALLSCGVKSDPLPPETPPDLGRGQPAFKRALRNVNLPNDSLSEDPEGQEDEDKDEEK